jgi:hypothetical protein
MVSGEGSNVFSTGWDYPPRGARGITRVLTRGERGGLKYLFHPPHSGTDYIAAMVPPFTRPPAILLSRAARGSHIAIAVKGIVTGHLRRTTRRLVLSLTRVTSSRRCFMLLCQACGLQLSYDLPELKLSCIVVCRFELLSVVVVRLQHLML